MKMIEDLDSCSKLVGKKIKYEDTVYEISHFSVELWDSTKTKHYKIKFIEENKDPEYRVVDLVLVDKHIRRFFQKCEWVND